MPTFPDKESDITALANQMIAGYKAHPADFPSSNWLWLDLKRLAYELSRNAQVTAAAQVRLATEVKDMQLQRLKGLMKDCLKKSEVDTTDDVEKLALIGWGPKAAPLPIEAPGQPDDFYPTVQGKGTLQLKWSKSAIGGAVRNYIIERREQPAGGGDFGIWTVAGSALSTEINLTGQSQGIELEYRVTAVNIRGESLPSNTSAVVL